MITHYGWPNYSAMLHDGENITMLGLPQSSPNWAKGQVRCVLRWGMRRPVH